MAKKLGIDRTHYGRILRGKAGGSITRYVYRRLMRLAEGAGQLTMFWQAILAPDARDLLTHYRKWLAGALRPFGLDWEVGLSDGVRRPYVPGRRKPRSQTSAEMVRQGRIVQLMQLPEFQEEFDHFCRWVGRRGSGWQLDDPRCALAIFRALAPLVCGSETMYMERSVEELRQSGQLRAYLRAALVRERILLSRVPDIQRAQELVREPTLLSKAR